MPKHNHRLKKHKYKTGAEIFFCTLPNCHFKIEAALMVGKISVCNLCGDDFVMTERDTNRVRPHCPKCGKVKMVGSDGKYHYFRKTAAPAILDEVAEGTVNDLRSRLNSAAVSDSEKDI